MRIFYWKTADLIDYARNPRKNDHAVDKAAAAIREFGFRVSVIVKSDKTIIDGHLRVKAAKKLGLDELPVIIADDMTEAQVKAFRISVNKIAELADWDDDLLRIELEELDEMKVNLEPIGFDTPELTNLFLDKEQGTTDPYSEWKDMPEFNQENKESMRHVIVHFKDEVDVREFFSLIGQSYTDKTKSIWFPEQERMDTEAKRY